MTSPATSILKNKFLNGWYLFWFASMTISGLVIFKMLSLDMSKGADVSYMIGYAVRFAIPIIFLVVATSALTVLFPNPLTHWLMRNRKHIGLTFAVAMFWQGLFIASVSLVHREYYFAEIYSFKDELEGTIGYILMGAMVVTSFYFARNKIDKSQWDLIHKAGIYFLWAYPFSTYWWSSSNYYGEGYAEFKHYFFYGMGLLAMLLRIAAWGKQRLRRTPLSEVTKLNKIIAMPFIIIGLTVLAVPMYWQPVAETLFYSLQWSADLSLWLPFYPFEPFLPFLFVVIGVKHLTETKKNDLSQVRVAGPA